MGKMKRILVTALVSGGMAVAAVPQRAWAAESREESSLAEQIEALQKQLDALKAKVAQRNKRPAPTKGQAAGGPRSRGGMVRSPRGRHGVEGPGARGGRFQCRGVGRQHHRMGPATCQGDAYRNFSGPQRGYGPGWSRRGPQGPMGFKRGPACGYGQRGQRGPMRGPWCRERG